MGSSSTKPQYALTPLQAQVWLIHSHACTVLFSHLSRNILREISAYIRIPPILPILHHDSLRLHAFEDHCDTDITLPVNFSAGAVCCIYQEEEIICLGSDPPRTEVYSFNLLLESFAAWQPMQNPRGWPGILSVARTLFVFGGCLSSCEKFQDGKWMRLPNMLTPKCAFTPVFREPQIFLGSLGTELEYFHMVSEKFYTLKMQLPGDAGPCIGFLIGDWIHVLGGDQAVRWNLGTRALETWTLRSVLQGCTGVPLRLRDRVYWADMSGQVVWYDLVRRQV